MASPLDLTQQSSALDTGLSALMRARNEIAEVRNASEAGPIARARLLTLHRSLGSTVSTLAQVAAVPGIGAYAQAQFDTQVTDFVAWAQAAATAIDDLKTWLWDNAVTLVNAGTITVVQYPEDGTSVLTQQTASTASLTAFRTAADVALAALNADA